MLKIKAIDSAPLALLLTGLALATTSLAGCVFAFLYLNVHGEQYWDGMAWVLMALGILSFQDGLRVARNSLRPGTTRLALVANSRTIAILRHKAPTVYVKRNRCVSVDISGTNLMLRDGSLIYLGEWEFGGTRLRKTFLRDFYGSWCPTNTEGEIGRFLVPRLNGRRCFAPYFLMSTVAVFLMGATATSLPVYILVFLAATPWIAFYLVGVILENPWRNHPPTPKSLYITPPSTNLLQQRDGQALTVERTTC